MEKASLKVSIIGIIGILIILLSGTLIFKTDIVLLIILSMLYIGSIACLNGWKLQDVYDGMIEGCTQAFIGLLFFLLIGAVIGSWIQAGTVPSLIYYGLEILNPKNLLATSFIICSIVSSVLGTSWGTVGTVGVAIIGVATSSGINIPLGIIAGAIVSGAWFGDKMSPISDTNVLIATTAKADIYKHIKVMLYTTIPSFIITVIIYSLINRAYVTNIELDYSQISLIKETLSQEFNLGIVTFIPVAVLVALCIAKVDATMSLILAIGAGVLCSIFVQGQSLEIALNSVMNGVSINTGIEAVDILLNRGGVNSMMSTFLLGFMALCLGGLLQKTGFLSNIIEAIAMKMKSTFSIVFMTMTTCVIGNAVFADTYLTIVLNSNMYRKLYEKRGLDSSMLSRVIAESATMSTPLIPWTAASAFITGALSIPTTEYASFAVLNLINPIISLGLTMFGIAVVKVKNDNKERRVLEA